MKRDGIPFSTELPGPLARRLREEKARTGRSLKVITAAFLRHCLDMDERERHMILRDYIETPGTAPGPPTARRLAPPSSGVMDNFGLDFDEHADVATLAARQGVTVPTDLDSLRGDFWPEEESIDDFLRAVRAWRSEET